MKNTITTMIAGGAILLLLLGTSSCGAIKTKLQARKELRKRQVQMESPAPAAADIRIPQIVSITDDISPVANTKTSKKFQFRKSRHSEPIFIQPLKTISLNSIPDHRVSVSQEQPVRSGGFGIAGFVMSFFSWWPPIGIMAIVFS